MFIGDISLAEVICAWLKKKTGKGNFFFVAVFGFCVACMLGLVGFDIIDKASYHYLGVHFVAMTFTDEIKIFGFVWMGAFFGVSLIGWRELQRKSFKRALGGFKNEAKSDVLLAIVILASFAIFLYSAYKLRPYDSIFFLFCYLYFLFQSCDVIPSAIVSAPKFSSKNS